MTSNKKSEKYRGFTTVQFQIPKGLINAQLISNNTFARLSKATTIKIPKSPLVNVQISPAMKSLTDINRIRFNENPFMSHIRRMQIVSDSMQRSIKPLVDFQRRANKIFEGLSKIGKAFRPFQAIQILANNQYVYWDYLSNEFVNEIIDAGACDNVDDFMINYYENRKDENIEYVIKGIKTSIISKPIKKMFTQAISAYRRKQYAISLAGLFVIVDFLLTNCSGNATTSIYRRGEAILEKLDNDETIESEELSILTLTMTFESMIKSISKSSDFETGEEPINLNRHWILHGRSERMIEQSDCIKIIYFIYSILLIQKISAPQTE